MNEITVDRSIPVLNRMLNDARALSKLDGDPVLAPRVAFLMSFLTETLALKHPQ